ncbi:MAG: HD domain-containing protein [Candidatus Dojkabacteria bacterium]|uniref:3'-5' exoribonuclease YhaM n=2 Tax=Candidatus Dojkabacteria TaxID=74243 RepID=A0A136KKK8_9BACT|nr:MAG: 3'-5' exoribonuclease YhaM [candidate division WS6 bacterium OLB21]MBW7954155.1 HD domain-containing protein [Candidatus Dojkabacteria bacterium]WKZ28043.1 MAG: HD domain-containing protein [Candidatus Dojkabacteria bacterium]
MKQFYVTDLKHGLQLNNETFAIKDATRQTTKAGKPFFRLTLQDKTGSIGAQIWSDSFASVDTKTISSGRVVMIDAMVEDYKGTLQLNISKLSAVDETALEEFVEASDFDLDDLWKQLREHIDSIQKPNIKKFLEKFFGDQDFCVRFKTAPAAEEIHHSFRGGLLEHVLEMLAIIDSFKKFYPEADYDIAKAGAILHDVGKLEEMKVEGTVVQRTKAGSLLGHIPLGFEMVSRYADNVLSLEEALNIKHIILSHHGQLEYGSPVKPATIEAIMVSEADDTSSKVRIFQKVLRRASSADGEFTEYDRILGTKVYKNTTLKSEATSLDDSELAHEQSSFA